MTWSVDTGIAPSIVSSIDTFHIKPFGKIPENYFWASWAYIKSARIWYSALFVDHENKIWLLYYFLCDFMLFYMIWCSLMTAKFNSHTPICEDPQLSFSGSLMAFLKTRDTVNNDNHSGWLNFEVSSSCYVKMFLIPNHSSCITMKERERESPNSVTHKLLASRFLSSFQQIEEK